MENRFEISQKEKELLESTSIQVQKMRMELNSVEQKYKDFISIVFCSRGIEIPIVDGTEMTIRIEDDKIFLLY